MKQTLLATAAILSLAGCEYLGDGSWKKCYPNDPEPCSENSESVYSNLEQQLESSSDTMPADVFDNPEYAEYEITLDDIKEGDAALYEQQPVEKIDGLGIEGKKISPDVAIAVASRNYGKTGSAKPIISDNKVTYPYGIGEAVLTCVPTRVCIIEMQKGEEVTNIVQGDSENWQIAEPLPTGTGANMQYHIMLKSVYDGHISSNLIITTNRRLYEITLKNKPSGKYTPKIAFYYPTDMLAWQKNTQQKQAEREKLEAKTTAISYENLNFDYKVRDKANKPWAPVNIFDDGRKVFIQMSKAMDVTEAPVLFEETEDGTLSIINYRVKGNTYIVDKLFSSAVMKLGEDDDEVITIARQG